MHPDQLQQQIRFQLGQLSATNGQAEFEKICLHFSRKRIHRNILPATGPVQAGGDQGRDFETFHTYLAGCSIANSSFFEFSSTKPTAFACSLQKNPSKKNGKIYRDVQTIMASGSTVERIYFFSGEDIPVGVRHKCQKVILDEFNVPLEIIDAQALSQHLSDPDLFWIAIQFLKIPSEFYPRNSNENWYSKLLKEYQDRNDVPCTIEEFSEIVSALRHIYKDDELKSDLVFWLLKTDQIIKNGTLPNFMIRKAIYEKFVASLMGLDIVDGQEDDIILYYSDFEDYTATGELLDAQVLLSFCLTSAKLGRHHLSESFLSDVAKRLDFILTKRERETENVDTKCFLIEIQYSFLFQDFRTPYDFNDQFNIALNKLAEIVPLLDQTSFYPIEGLSDRLNELISILSEVSISSDHLERIIEQVDKVLAEKSGTSILAKKLIERATNYLSNEQHFKALKTLHESKIKWFNEETFKESIISCLFLADTYRKLNMFFAAKYYAYVAAYFAINSTNPTLTKYFPQGLSIAVDCDYASGSWISNLTTLDLLLIANSRIIKDFNIYEQEDAHLFIVYPAIIYEYAIAELPEVRVLIESFLNKWPFIKEDLTQASEKIKIQVDESQSKKLKEIVKDQIFGSPFNDIGRLRKVSFNASGCNWHFNFKNDYDLNAIAEEFIAILQILITDLEPEELYIISTNIFVNIALTTSKEPDYRRLPSNTESLWEINLPPYRGETLAELHAHEYHYLIIAQAIIYELSLLPTGEYMDLFEKKITTENLIGKVTFGRPYEDLYHHIVDAGEFNATARWAFNNPLTDKIYPGPLNLEIPLKNSTATKYDEEKALEAIGRRIQQLRIALSVTLPILRKSSPFHIVLEDLKRLGWLEWQILFAIGTIVVNYKGRFREAPKTKEEAQAFSMQYFRKDEKDWYIPIPLELLNYDRLAQEMDYMMVSTLLNSFGLQFHSQTPNGKAITELLKNRFSFFEDGKNIKIF